MRSAERSKDTASSGEIYGQYFPPAGFRGDRAAFRISSRTRCRRQCVHRNIDKTFLLGPLSRLIKLQRLRLARAWFGFEVINPAHEGRKTHQDRFGPAPRFQSENRTAVI